MTKHLVIAGSQVRTNDAGLVSLTDIYAAAERESMADGKQDPRQWKRREGEQFIAFIAENMNVSLRHIYIGTKGKGGGTFAHWQVALAIPDFSNPAAAARAWAEQYEAPLLDSQVPIPQTWISNRQLNTLQVYWGSDLR